MKIRTRTSIAAVAVASVIGGGIAGAVLTGPTAANAQEAEEETTVVERRTRIGDVLAPLVEDGVITQAQAEAVVEALENARPDRSLRGFRGIGPALDEIAATLDLTVDELGEALRNGSSLAELAAEHGVDVDLIIDQLVTQAQERLDAAVADGHLTDDEAAERLADMETRITEMVNGELEFGRRGFGHGHRGRHGLGEAPDTEGASNADDAGFDV